MKDNFYKQLIEGSPTGYAYHRIIFDKDDNPIDYEIQEINAAYESLTGLKRSDIVGKRMYENIPDFFHDEFNLIKCYGEVAIHGARVEFEQYSEVLKKWYRISVYSPQKRYLATQFIDISNEKEQIRDMQWLVQTSERLLNIDETGVDYAEIADDFLKICGAKCAVFNLYDEDGKKFTTKAISGDKGIIENASRTFGFALIGKQWENDPVRAEKIKHNTVTRFSSLNELVGDVIPKSLIELIKKMFLLGEVVLIKITRNNVMIGDFTIVMPIGVSFSKDTVVEIYTKQLGVAILREWTTSTVKESENKYRLLTENITDVIWTVDLEGHLTYISPAIEKQLGYTPEEIMSMPMHEFFVREDYDAIMAKLAKELAKPPAERPNTTSMQVCYKTKDNRLVYVELNTVWIKDEQGNTIGVQGSSRDITERKQLEKKIIESKKMYQSVIDTQQEMVCRYLPDSTITFVNDAYCRAFRKKYSELLGRKYLMFIPRESQEDELASLTRLSLAHPSDTREFEVTLPDGSTGWQEWTDVGVFDESGELIEIQGVGRDITERILAEKNMLQAYDATIEGWAHALDLKDEETQDHSQRVTKLTLHIAGNMGIKEEELVHIRRGALLHDIGKMGIPDSILLKPGKLTEKEWEIMRRHPVYALEMLSSIDYLRPALDIPYCHHEKWDGSGYPRGLRGNQISLASRIFAVVDVYDALTSDRPYRRAWSKEKTLEYIKEQSGSHFDPQIVDVFVKEIASLIL